MLRIMFSRYFVIVFLLIIFQQLIVASSIFFIANLAKAISEGGISWVDFIGFVASLTLVYIPVGQTLNSVYGD